MCTVKRSLATTVTVCQSSCQSSPLSQHHQHHNPHIHSQAHCFGSGCSLKCCLACQPRLKCALMTSRTFLKILGKDQFTCRYHKKLQAHLHQRPEAAGEVCDVRDTSEGGRRGSVRCSLSPPHPPETVSPLSESDVSSDPTPSSNHSSHTFTHHHLPPSHVTKSHTQPPQLTFTLTLSAPLTLTPHTLTLSAPLTLSCLLEHTAC